MFPLSFSPSLSLKFINFISYIIHISFISYIIYIIFSFRYIGKCLFSQDYFTRKTYVTFLIFLQKFFFLFTIVFFCYLIIRTACCDLNTLLLLQVCANTENMFNNSLSLPTVSSANTRHRFVIVLFSVITLFHLVCRHLHFSLC